MATLAELQASREALFLARSQGVRSVRDSNGEEIRYSSDREMAAALATLDREISALQSGQPAKTILFRTSKGL